MSQSALPIGLRQAGDDSLEITWGDGHVSAYRVAYLRRACRCASCVDEWTGVQRLDPEAVSSDVKPVTIDPVGRYAIHIAWSDGHTAGIYSFDYLRSICPCSECRAHAGPAR